MTPQNRAHGLALHAPPFAMDQAYFAETSGATLLEVLVDDTWNVPRQERMQVDTVRDWENSHLVA